MNKIIKWINNMSKGKKIYSVLWIFTGLFLITIIAMFVSFRDTINEKDLKPYKISVVAPLLKNKTDKLDYKIQAKEGTPSTGIKGLDGSQVTFNKGDFQSIKNVANIYEYKKYFGDLSSFNYKEPTGTTVYATKDALFELKDVSELNSKAKSSQNAIAAVGFIFLVLLTASIVVTTVVSKKEKGGDK